MPLSALTVSSCGHPVWMSHRADIAKALYDTLPEDAKKQILLKKRVIGIKVLPDGVEVTCQDDSVERGSIVLGTDGVRSIVRQVMNGIEKGKQNNATEIEKNLPYISSHRVFFGDVPKLPGVEAGVNYEGLHDGVATQLLVGSNRMWFNLYEQLETPTSDHIRYTEGDQQEMVDKWGHLFVAPGYQLRDVYERRLKDTGMINLEEGLVDEWYSDRIALAGDAVRKLTNNAGWGYNSGVTDIVVLVNHLRRLLKSDQSPSSEALKAVFKQYQADRAESTRITYKVSADRVRAVVWPGWLQRIIATYILPYVSLGKLDWILQSRALHRDSPVLEWLAEKSLPSHRIKYKQYPQPEQ
jgi:2-polyprenyl-6-methoxyphenol hydroxylase-like FAD-dependent oxidoreductase